MLSLLFFFVGANLKQMQHLPSLPSLQSFGSFDPTSFGKLEQNLTKVAFAIGLHQIYYTGKSMWKNSRLISRQVFL